MKKNILLKCLLMGAISSVGALADIVVDKSNGVLSIVSQEGKTMRVKVVAPDNTVIVDTEAMGSYTWTPTGADGAYRYNVRVVPISLKVTSVENNIEEISDAKSDYAGGSVEVKDFQIVISQNPEIKGA